MNKVKSFITTFAFIFALGTAFSSVQTNVYKDLIKVKGKAAHCPTGRVSDECHLASDGPVCSFVIDDNIYKAVPEDSKDCQMASTLHRPE